MLGAAMQKRNYVVLAMYDRKMPCMNTGLKSTILEKICEY